VLPGVGGEMFGAAQDAHHEVFGGQLGLLLALRSFFGLANLEVQLT
jgi:hypothetical protein